MLVKMKKLIKNKEKVDVNSVSIKKVMDNAYQIAERSGFYFPYRKYEWLESNTD